MGRRENATVRAGWVGAGSTRSSRSGGVGTAVTAPLAAVPWSALARNWHASSPSTSKRWWVRWGPISAVTPTSHTAVTAANSDHHRSRMKGIATVPEYATWPGGRVTGSGLRWRPLGVLLIAFLGGRREHRPGGQDDDYDEPDREEPPEPPARAAGRHGAPVIRPG